MSSARTRSRSPSPWPAGTWSSGSRTCRPCRTPTISTWLRSSLSLSAVPTDGRPGRQLCRSCRGEGSATEPDNRAAGSSFLPEPRRPADAQTRGDEPSDADLLRAHIDGDPDAFGKLFARHRDRLWAVAIRTLGDPEEAADALQDAMISAFRRAGSFRGD